MEDQRADYNRALVGTEIRNRNIVQSMSSSKIIGSRKSIIKEEAAHGSCSEKDFGFNV